MYKRLTLFIISFIILIAYLISVINQKDVIIAQKQTKIELLQSENRLLSNIAANESSKRQLQMIEFNERINSLKQKRILTTDDIKSLEKIVEVETRGEGIEGKCKVASVVINRLINRNFKTVKEVIFDPGQFPQSSKLFYSTIPSDETKQSVMLATYKDYSHGAEYFMNPVISSRGNVTWFRDRLKLVGIYKNHQFYK